MTLRSQVNPQITKLQALMARDRPFASSFVLIAIALCLSMAALTHAGAQADAQTTTPAAPVHLTIDPSDIVTPVSPTLYGLMTEEINHAFDGGLYAELLQNRTFRASWEGVQHWTLVRDGDASASMQSDKTSGPPHRAAKPESAIQVTGASPSRLIPRFAGLSTPR